MPAAPAPKAVPPAEALVWPSPEVEPVILSETPPLREMPAFWSKPEAVALRSAMEEFVEVVDILFPVMFVPVVEVFIPC